MSSRIGYWLAVLLLLVSAGLRMADFTGLPTGLYHDEVTEVRLAESVRGGAIEVFYDVDGVGRETLYPALLTVLTSFTGGGLFGYKIMSFWAGLLALAVLYALTQRLFGPVVGVAALALAAVNFWLILLSRLVTPVALLPLLVLTVLLLLARTLAIYREHNRRIPENTVFALLGLLLGIGFYLHPAHILLALFSVLFIAVRLLSKKPPSRQAISYLLFSLLLMMIIAMPYVISSIRLPALSGAARLFGAFGEAPFFETVARSLNALFFLGDARPAHNMPGRPWVDLVSGLLILVGVLSAVRQWRSPRYALLLGVMALLLPAALLASEAPDFRALTLVFPLLVIFFGLGVSTLYRSVAPRRRELLWLAAFALLIYNFTWMGLDFFSRWPQIEAVRDAYHDRAGRLALHLSRTSGVLPTVICDSQVRLHPEDALSSTDLMLLMTTRQQGLLRYADCGSGLIFADGGAPQQVVMPDPNTFAQMQPYLRDWLNQGQFVPGLPPESVVQLSLEETLAAAVGRFTTTAPTGYAPDAPGGGGLAAPPVRLGGNISFLGYEPLSDVSYAPGDILTSITYWRVDGRVPPDLRLFTHVLTDPASIAVQNDTISVRIAELADRDIFIQMMFVPLPPAIPPGEYDISIGAYTATDNQRMPVLDADNTPRGNRLFIGRITVG